MNKKFTELTTVLMMTALCALPLAGQERGVVKMGPALHDGVQLRVDEAEALPDSAIRYAPDGQRQTKYVYAGENRGTYTWENNAWRFESTEVNTSILSSEYRMNKNLRHLVNFECRTREEKLYLIIPMGIERYFYYAFPLDIDFKTEHDAHGNMTFLQLLYSEGRVYLEFTANYNAGNNPVSIEGRNDVDIFFKAHYEYNDFGYPTLSECYDWNPGKGIWESPAKQIAEYDMQGKILNWTNSLYNEISSTNHFEYYDENHYSSMSYDDYLNESNSWKWEYKYGTDGKLGARYNYQAGELEEYYIIYPNTLDNPDNANEPPTDMRIWSYGGNLHVRTAQPDVLHVHTLTGALHAQQTLPAGETTLPLPPGMYIVKVGDRTEKVVVGK
jgi:hypothetical protein